MNVAVEHRQARSGFNTFQGTDKLMRSHPPTPSAAWAGSRRLLACAAALTCLGTTQTASAQAVLDYAGKWTFDDCSASSSLLRDTSGNNATATRGTSVVCTTDQEGRANGAVNLLVSQPGNGTTATTVRVPNTTAFPLSTHMSVSARIKPGAMPDGAILTKMWTDASGVVRRTFQLSIARDTAGNARLRLDLLVKSPTGTTPVSLNIESDQTIPASTWTQVGASFDPQNGMQLYINGQPDGGPRLNAAIFDAPAGTPSTMFIGGSRPQGTVGYTGAVDDVWVSKGSCADLQSGRVASSPNELMITHLGVVNDPVRTTGKGAWTFGRLMEQMVPHNPSAPQASVDAAADMVENMFKSFDVDQVINKQTVKARRGVTNVHALVLNSWPRLANGKLDLAQSPLRLLAVVNRMDLRDLSQGHAGEGRFVYGVLRPDGTPSSFTFILEYRLPAKTPADIRVWARDWHALGTMAIGSAAYNTALQAITDRFTSRGAAPTRFNGSAIGQVRTNEIALSGTWELRQFELGAGTAGISTLVPSPVAMTPGDVFKTTLQGFVAGFINDNATAILANNYTVPLAPTISGVKVSFFQGGSALVTNTPWDGPEIQAPTSQLRHTFALNTCNGCHSAAETGTGFLHIGTRSAGTASTLSRFLTGITNVRDPVDGVTLRSFNDLQRRQVDMNTALLVCPAPATASTTTTLSAARTASTLSTGTASTGTSAPSTSLTKGIGRVH